MLTHQASQYARHRLIRRVSRSLPWIGTALAIVTLGSAIRRKGVFGGAVHTALDALPYIGGVKNMAEAYRGRDFIRDRERIARRAQAAHIHPQHSAPQR